MVAELLMDARDEYATQIIITHWDHIKFSPPFLQAALCMAKPETIALAASALAESPAPEDLLDHIDMSWGIRTNGRKGVTELAQLQALEPYYHRLSEAKMGDIRILHFFDAANQLGALEWRKVHLDPLLAKSKRGHCPSEPEAVFASLDSEVETYLKFNQRYFGIDHWFTRREEELWKRGALFDLIGEWARQRASTPATKLLCEALMHFGERKDLSLFQRLPEEIRVACADEIVNCDYEVRRRSLAEA
jgi:hypothetical protein